MLTGTGTPTQEAVTDGRMDRYTTNAESSCPLTDIHLVTTMLYSQSVNCFDIQYTPAAGYLKPFTFGDGSKITYTSSDPEASLDSTAVFHFGA